MNRKLAKIIEVRVVHERKMGREISSEIILRAFQIPFLTRPTLSPALLVSLFGCSVGFFLHF